MIRVEEVSLRYRLARQRIPSLKEYAISWMRGALAYDELWALQDVSLTLEPGESLGVIGRNGAGKSSLLKVVSGVLQPTRGRATVDGTVAPILGLGTGFDPELTGFENIYLNALLLGRTRREIDAQVEEIIEFSGIREFIHSPIRNYSTGMQARLGFSVATAWVPDVVILDEVLAVGDASFLRRCEARLADFRERGTTLLLVSHDLSAVKESCERALWLDRGRVQALGPVDEVMPLYLDFSARQ